METGDRRWKETRKGEMTEEKKEEKEEKKEKKRGGKAAMVQR